MPKIQSFRPRSDLRIDTRVQSTNISQAGAGAVDRAISNVAADTNKLATQIVERDKIQQAKVYDINDSASKEVFMSQKYEEATSGYNPNTETVSVPVLDANGDVVSFEDTGKDIHKFIKDESSAYDLSNKDKAPSGTASRLSELSRERIESKYMSLASGHRISENKKNQSRVYENTNDTINKGLQKKQGKINRQDIEDAFNEQEVTYRNLDMVMAFDQGESTLKASKDKTSAMIIDSLIDGNNLGSASGLLLVPQGGSKVRSDRLQDFKDSVTQTFLKQNAGKSERVTGGTLIRGEDGKSGVLMQSDGTIVKVSDMTKYPTKVTVETPEIGIQGEFKPYTKVYDNMTDDTYARSLDRLQVEAKKAKSETSRKAVAMQRGLISMMSNPNEAVRKLPDFKSDIDPMAQNFRESISLIEGSIQDTSTQDAMITELYAAYGTGMAFQDLKLSSPAESKKYIDSLGKRLNAEMFKLGLAIPEHLQAPTIRKTQEMLQKYEANRLAQAKSPNYFIGINGTLSNNAESMMKGGSHQPYLDQLSRLRSKVGISDFEPKYPKQYTEGLSKQLVSLQTAGTAGVLKAQGIIKDLKVNSGTGFNSLWKEMEAAGLPSSYKTIGMFPSTVDGDRAGATVLSNLANKKTIAEGLKTFSPEDYKDNVSDIKKSVSAKMRNYRDYYSKALAVGEGSKASASVEEALFLEVSTGVSAGEDISDAMEDGYNKIFKRNFIIEEPGNSPIPLIMDKGLMQTKNITEDEARAMMKVYSEESNISELVGVEVMSSSHVKDQLQKLGFEVGPQLRKDYENGDYGETIPMFSGEGISFKMIPKGSAHPFTILGTDGKPLIIPFEDAKRSPLVQEEASRFIDRAEGLADKTLEGTSLDRRFK